MSSDPVTVTLTLIGGPTLLIEIGGLRLLTDPTFDPPQSYQGGVVLTKAHAFNTAAIVTIHNEGWAHFSETQQDVATLFGALGLSSRLPILERGVPMLLELS